MCSRLWQEEEKEEVLLMIPKILIKIYWLALKSWGKESHKIQEKEWKKLHKHIEMAAIFLFHTYSLSHSLVTRSQKTFFPLVLIIFLLALTCVFFCASRRTYKNHKHAAKQFYRFFVLSHSLSRSCFPLGTQQRDDDNEIQWKSSSRNFH